MNETQFLLNKLAEECGEVAHECHKAMVYGLDSVNPYNDKINVDCLINELNDMIAILHMLVARDRLPVEWMNSEAQNQKVLKVLRSMDECKKIGLMRRFGK